MSILTDDGDWRIMTNEPNEMKCSTPKLRSILRKNLEENSIQIREKEKDSDYTGDEDDDENDNDVEKTHTNPVSTKKKNPRKKQQHYSRSSPNQFLQSISSANSRQSTQIKEDSIINNPISHRTLCVTFTDDQPAIIQRSLSTPPSGGFHPEQHLSINMKESSSIPTETISDYRPVYVPPLKYRPLIGLSANDNRLLLEKRVSLLGKPLVFHPIQKRSLFYRRTQLRIYNFLERADSYKAVIYHTFV